MYRTKLILGTLGRVGLADTEQIELFQRIGFDGFFTDWCAEADHAAVAACAKRTGMIWQSIHAPFGKMRHMWYESEQTASAADELITCLRDCARFEVPIMVTHTFIGFKDHTPTALGIENYGRVVAEAERLGVKIAFENTEGEEYLKALMDAFSESPAVGFCWDTGHEMCYNHTRDMLALYGDRLIATHINDNLGIRDYGGEITYHDDHHMLPFDGVGNWHDIAARLKRHRFTDLLTFELKRDTAPTGIAYYARMSLEEYLTEAYVRACRVATLCNF